MPIKSQQKKVQTYTVNVSLTGEVSVEVPSSSLEEAISQVRGFNFRNVIEHGCDDISVDTEVTGAFKN